METYSEDPANKDDDGKVGYVSRLEVKRFELDFLRETFADLGFKNPDGVLLRGPIVARRWIYLVRVDKVVTEGVVDMERVRGRVVRSLREKILRRDLAEISQGVERSVLLPITR